MFTPQQYLDKYGRDMPSTMWVHGLDLLQHCMQAASWKTFYKDLNPNKEYLWEVQEELEKHAQAEKDNLNKVLEDGLRSQNKWQRFDDFSGDLDISRFLADRSGNTAVFNNYKKDRKFKPAMNILLDMAIPWGERGSNEMLTRHKKIYELTVQAWNEGRPCRVVACVRSSLSESGNEVPHVTLLVVIKDFSDPIFSGIWGAFKTNASTNSFLNVIMDYWIGTHHYGNGCSMDFRASEYFQPNEVKIVNAKRILP